MKSKSEVDKREHARYKIEQNMYVALKDGITKVGKLKDISLGGLAFNCLEDDHFDRDRGHVDIFTSGKDFYMPNIPVRVVYNTRQPTSDFSVVVMNRCGIAFDRLTENQVEILMNYFHHHATPSSSP